MAYELLKKIIESAYTDLEALKALDYLTKFNNEYHKAVIKKGDRTALHNTKKLRQERYSANNARNRDILSMQRHKVDSLTPHPVETGSGMKLKHLHIEIHSKNPEEVLADLIDLKNKPPN